ncbi:hypothetical protein [Paenibacillus macquariensis]|uniref:Uncharacterized protein n=1 Tax=Paenibacillus macquariensis TaxID=948756 RepID=A0ABY1KCA9_9BACL|nr:hypothetical protein [Paenibacillus macquariensis]MEC0093903.1 hypothetical protein [Paenibacillus macquariensis]OAB33039.1 hypothetical protein PMSM_15875 [Paenibacillus macquariensis subsp. macquariensis]SIR58986.1 hypothetical protein SAMN05421578_1217 [Paenibacillus macquariensis]
MSIIGNTMQSIANAAQAELTAELWETTVNKDSNDLTVVGNLLQSLGNALQVIAAVNAKANGNRNASRSKKRKPYKTKG